MLFLRGGFRTTGSMRVRSIKLMFNIGSSIIISLARINLEESFSVVFSLVGVSETNHFVARQRELNEIHQSLNNGSGRQAVTLHGLGGIGKTQLAIAYAKSHRIDYTAIFWLNIKDEVSVKQSYSHIARRILQEHPSTRQLGAITEDTQLDIVILAVKRWMNHAKNTRWLMVFDNYDNPKFAGNADPTALDIQQFIPEAYHGSIMVTTRSSKVCVGQRIPVRKLKDIGDSLQILSNLSGRGDIMKGQSLLLIVKSALTVRRSRCNCYCKRIGRTSTCPGYSRGLPEPGINKLCGLSSLVSNLVAGAA